MLCRMFRMFQALVMFKVIQVALFTIAWRNFMGKIQSFQNPQEFCVRVKKFPQILLMFKLVT